MHFCSFSEHGEFFREQQGGQAGILVAQFRNFVRAVVGGRYMYKYFYEACRGFYAVLLEFIGLVNLSGFLFHFLSVRGLAIMPNSAFFQYMSGIFSGQPPPSP